MRLADGLYPGCSLHELTVQGLSTEAVLLATVQIIAVIVEAMGLVSAGEENIEPGSSRMKLVLPSKAAAAVIGPGGATVKLIRQQCGVRTAVDMNSVPCGGGHNEQAVLLSGATNSLQNAFPIVLEQVARSLLRRTSPLGQRIQTPVSRFQAFCCLLRRARARVARGDMRRSFLTF